MVEQLRRSGIAIHEVTPTVEDAATSRRRLRTGGSAPW
jgi:hypothetical protein